MVLASATYRDPGTAGFARTNDVGINNHIERHADNVIKLADPFDCKAIKRHRIISNGDR